MLHKHKISFLSEVIRYGLIGIALNLFWYIVYLYAVRNGFQPKLVVILCYPLSISLSLIIQSTITFKRRISTLNKKTVLIYVILYIIGLALNIALLEVFYKIIGIRHELVQASSVVLVAGYLFISSRCLLKPSK